MAYTIITPLVSQHTGGFFSAKEGKILILFFATLQILLAYAVEGTDRIHRTSLDVLFSITGAFALIALGGEIRIQINLVRICSCLVREITVL